MDTDPKPDALDYDTLVEDENDFDDGITVEEVVPEPDRRRPVWPWLVLLGAGLGFAAAFAASWYTRPAPFDPAPLRAELASLRAEFADATSAGPSADLDLRPLQRRIAALEARPQADPDTSDLEARITALETRPEPTLDEDLVARLEALREDGFTGAPAPDLSALIARVDALEARPAPDTQGAIDLGPLEARLDALESRGVAPVAPAVIPSAELPPFPAQALRDGVEAQRGGLLSKHFRVRSDDDPLTLIEGIEADMAAGRATQALAKFDRLPEPLRNLARGWRADMETTIR